jgi:hypothetical protein
MDPDADHPSLANSIGGGSTPPPALARSSHNALPSGSLASSAPYRLSMHTASSHLSRLSGSIHNNPPSQRSPSTNNIVLHISLAAGSATFGYIYVAETELRHKAAITAYFESAGREVTSIPCPDFETYIADNNLMYRDILFITDLPRYVIPAGIRILKAHRYNDSPHYDWLPAPPDLASFNPLSLPMGTSTSSSQQSWSLLTHQSSPASGHRPDPDALAGRVQRRQ